MKRTVAKDLGHQVITDYKVQKSCIGYEVVVKLPGMRKIDDFSIYPLSRDSKHLFIQGDKKCAKINLETLELTYTNKGSMPMDLYLLFCPTYKYTVQKQFLDDMINAITHSKNYDNENGAVVIDFCNL